MIEFLQKVSLFSQLNPEQLQSIANICSKKTFKAGTVLFKEKEPGSVFYIVLTGSVKIYTTGQTGEEKIFAIFKSGDSFGELSLIDGKPRSTSAQTLEDSSLLALSAQNFLDLCKTNFDITHCIMQELCQRLRDTNDHVNDLIFLDARSRVIKNIITLANKNGTRNGTLIHIRLALNYDELSRMAGVQKNVLLQVIRDLQDKKILLLGINEFTLDLAKLRS